MPDHFQDQPLSVSDTRRIGQIGEELASEILKKQGYRLVLANFQAPIGRNRRGVQITGEIDLIGLDSDVICFVEVKTRSSDEFATPLSAVDLRKQRQITRTARVYRKIFGLQLMKYRYDVVSIVLPDKELPEIEIYKGFWSDTKFHKKYWLDDF